MRELVALGLGREKLQSEPLHRVALVVSEKMKGNNAELQLKNSARIGFKLVLLHLGDLKDLEVDCLAGEQGVRIGKMGECTF